MFIMLVISEVGGSLVMVLTDIIEGGVVSLPTSFGWISPGFSEIGTSGKNSIHPHWSFLHWIDASVVLSSCHDSID